MLEINKYKISNRITKNQLLKFGFTYRYPDEYIYRIPCYKYKDISLLYLEFIIMYDNDNGNIKNPILIINCKNKDNSQYIAFYNNEEINNNKVLEIVNKKLSNTLNKMYKQGIVKQIVKKQRKKR